MAEVAYITATQSEKLHRRRALQFYGTALIHAYRYLFDYKDDVPGRRGALAINPYDPQFRGASDLYNQSLEGMIRLVRQEGELRPGISRTVTTANNTCSFEVCMHSTGWHSRISIVWNSSAITRLKAAKSLSRLRSGCRSSLSGGVILATKLLSTFILRISLFSGHRVSPRRTANGDTGQVTAAKPDRIVYSARIPCPSLSERVWRPTSCWSSTTRLTGNRSRLPIADAALKPI
jgi:hypothetical protein